MPRKASERVNGRCSMSWRRGGVEMTTKRSQSAVEGSKVLSLVAIRAEEETAKMVKV